MLFPQTLLRHCRHTYGRAENSLAYWSEHRKQQQPTVSLSPFALQANEAVEAEEIEGVAKDSSPVPANASPLVLQFFQVCAALC